MRKFGSRRISRTTSNGIYCSLLMFFFANFSL
ncbi:hypothetical protein FKZ59_00635 [Ureibacillus terrenus]|uniref:Uncharacterized protein n=1 Tax=Ureibacillus terrenus TaxID=118246 RepID=A0A540V6W3_9BACL|nr:hypothetical protein FKZ59_00635 [Ureibacillus terrenus]